jgi:ABC-type transport system substrate-binding protein
MGVAPQRQFQDLQVGKADIAELTPDQMRRASQAGLRTWVSAPVELFALVFEPETSWDPRIRQALSLSVDRQAITNVLLQKFGEPAGSLLPQWLTGYAFLFPVAPDVERAQQLRLSTRAAGLPASRPLHLGVENRDETARLIAERVALNARPAGITIQLNARDNFDVTLVHWRLASVTAHRALADLLRVLDPSDQSAAALKKNHGDDPEQSYAAERAIIENYQVIPLVYLPEAIALGPAVRDWMPSRWAAWRLEDVWLDRLAAPEDSSGAGIAGAKP